MNFSRVDLCQGYEVSQPEVVSFFQEPYLVAF